jgi:hypothetical protein
VLESGVGEELAVELRVADAVLRLERVHVGAAEAGAQARPVNLHKSFFLSQDEFFNGPGDNVMVFKIFSKNML